MTLIRGIWLIWSDGQQATVVYSRKFSTVEARLKRQQNQAYVSVPNNVELLRHISNHLRLSLDSVKFSENRDSCDRWNTFPVYSIPLQEDKILDLVVIQEKNWLFCCAPVIDSEGGDSNYINCNPAVPIALAALNGILQLLYPMPLDNTLGNSKLHILDTYLCQAMPFGRPIDVDPLVYKAKLQNKNLSTNVASKQPAWKPLSYKGRANISLTITESIKCVQFGRPDALDELQCHGNVSCLALLEGVSPEITLTITHEDPKQLPDISSMVVHPCVSSLEPAQKIWAPPPMYKLRFMPPLDKINLCNYLVSNVKTFPVHGAFKLRESEKTEFLLQLKLDESTTNSFEYFEVKIPFFDREIQKIHLRPSWGMTNISPDRRTIIWNLGNRFPAKASETSLKATILFIEKKDQTGDGLQEKQMKSSTNYFAQVNFCTKAHLLSGGNIDPKSVHTSPPAKFKFQLDKELMTSDYKIWNSNSSVSPLIPISENAFDT